MKKLTYKEAYDMIINAYFKDEIKPMSPKFCFCGTLAPDLWWGSSVRSSFYGSAEYPYSVGEYKRMEEPLLLEIGATKDRMGEWVIAHPIKTENDLLGDPRFDEDKIFEGMCKSLEVLKEIHRERGEDVDLSVPVFTKRNLVKV